MTSATAAFLIVAIATSIITAIYPHKTYKEKTIVVEKVCEVPYEERLILTDVEGKTYLADNMYVEPGDKVKISYKRGMFKWLKYIEYKRIEDIK